MKIVPGVLKAGWPFLPVALSIGGSLCDRSL